MSDTPKPPGFSAGPSSRDRHGREAASSFSPAPRLGLLGPLPQSARSARGLCAAAQPAPQPWGARQCRGVTPAKRDLGWTAQAWPRCVLLGCWAAGSAPPQLTFPPWPQGTGAYPWETPSRAIRPGIPQVSIGPPDTRPTGPNWLGLCRRVQRLDITDG